MARTEETRLFLRYRATGDPGALAAVFDRVAPRLLLVAVHLCRDESLAEDLVQLTFVTAMENAEQFRAEQSLLPWLNGILLNRWREERRRRARLPDAAGVETAAGGEPGPRSEAEAAELIDAVHAALERLPASYRSALSLRLVHGLRPVQIAHALGVSPGTVRSQLKRGLELLRGHLPRSLALPAVTALVAGEGLAAVRARVLQHASEACVAGTVTGTGVLLIMKKWVLVAIMAVLVIGSFFFGWSAWTTPAGEREDAAARQAAGRSAVDAAGDARAAERSKVEAVGEAGRDVVERVLTITGRCIDGDTGQPLPGSRARVERVFRGGEWEYRAPWRDPDPTPCDASGAFTIRLTREHAAARGLYRLAMMGAPERIQQSGFDELRFGAAERLDLGDVRMFRTVSLTGRITDKTGAPLRGIELVFHRVQLNPLSSQDKPRTMADADGRFRIRLERGSWSIDTRTLSRAADDELWSNRVTPEGVDLTGPADRVEVELVSDPICAAHRIAGRVVDATGDPVSAIVRFVEPERNRSWGEGRTNAAGEFAAYVWKEWAPAESPGVRAIVTVLGANGVNHRGTLRHPSALHSWGSDDVTIALVDPPTRRVPIGVVVADDGAAVERFGVSVGHDRLPRVRPATHANGAAEVVVPQRGRRFFRVYPEDPDLLPSRIIPVPKPAAATPIEVEVYRRGQLAVRVEDAAGAPVVGTRVQLVEPPRRPGGATQPKPLRIWRGAIGSAANLRIGDSGLGHDAFIVSSRVTDENGIAKLDGPVGVDDLVVTVAGSSHVACDVRGVQVPADGAPLRVTVRRGATIRGTVRPREAIAMLTTPDYASRDRRRKGLARDFPGVVLIGEGQRVPPKHSGAETIRLAPDGSFVANGLAPGTWKLFFAYQPSSLTQYGRRFVGMAFEKLGDGPLATIRDLRDGETRRVDLDIAEHVPGRLEGRVLANGRPVALETIYFFRVEGRRKGDGQNPSAITDRDGRFVMPQLPPGEYVLWRKLRGVWKGKPWYLSWVPFEERIRVTGGQSVTQEFHAKLGSLLLRFARPGGKPLGLHSVRLTTHESWHETERVDAEGCLRLPLYPCGEVRLTPTREGIRFEPDRVRLRGTGEFEEFDIVVRDAKK